MMLSQLSLSLFTRA